MATGGVEGRPPGTLSLYWTAAPIAGVGHSRSFEGVVGTIRSGAAPLWSVGVDGSGDGRRMVEVGLRRVLVVEGIEAEIMRGRLRCCGVRQRPVSHYKCSPLIISERPFFRSSLPSLVGTPDFSHLNSLGLCVVRVKDERACRARATANGFGTGRRGRRNLWT